MAGSSEPRRIEQMLWRGRWIMVLCTLASVAIAVAVVLLQPPRYQAEIRIRMMGLYSSPDARRALYEEFSGWRTRIAPFSTTPAGVTVSEGYNPVSETATVVLTLPEEHAGFAADYFEALTASLDAFSRDRMARAERKLQILDGLATTAGLTGSDHLASLAAQETFLLEDARSEHGVIALLPPTGPRRLGNPSLLPSVIFGAVIGMATGIAFLFSREIWRKGRASAGVPKAEKP